MFTTDVQVSLYVSSLRSHGLKISKTSDLDIRESRDFSTFFATRSWSNESKFSDIDRVYWFRNIHRHRRSTMIFAHLTNCSTIALTYYKILHSTWFSTSHDISYNVYIIISTRNMHVSAVILRKPKSSSRVMVTVSSADFVDPNFT